MNRTAILPKLPPDEAEPHLQSVLFTNVVLALRLGRPAGSTCDVRRGAHLERMRHRG